MASSTQHIALFPLGLFLLPGEYTQLYIFEERYKQLINDCLAGSLPNFGIVFNHRENPSNYGSLVRLHKVLKTHPNGEMDVILEAVGLFKLQNFEFQHLNKAYPAGEILLLEDLPNPPASPQMISAFTSYIDDAPARELAMYNTQEPQLFEMATEILDGPLEKLDFLTQPSWQDQETFLINYLRYLQFLDEQKNSVQNGIYLN